MSDKLLKAIAKREERTQKAMKAVKKPAPKTESKG